MKEHPDENYVVEVRNLVDDHSDRPELARWLPGGWEVIANNCVSIVFLPVMPLMPWPPPVPEDLDRATDADDAARHVFAANNLVVTPTDAAERTEELVGSGNWERQTVFWISRDRYAALEKELRDLEPASARLDLRLDALPEGEVKAFLERDLPRALALSDYDRKMLCLPPRG